MRRRRTLALVSLLAACRDVPGEPPAPDAAASPQATAIPAPLASPTPSPSAGVAASIDGGPPPTPIRGDVALAADLGARETTGYTLSAVVRHIDPTGPSRGPEVSAAGIEAARKKTETRLAIDASPSRLRAVLQGTGWVLPETTEVRARADRYGHVVLWPGGGTYRPLAPGALRALFGERRFDVAPVTLGEVIARDQPTKRIGIRARKVEIVTRAARASLEIGKLEGLGEGGVLLCRMLLDLVGAAPGTPACGLDEVPLRAEMKWTTRGAIGFELTGVLRRTDMAASLLTVPPPLAAFADAPPPAASVAPLLTPSELAAFRNGPIDVPESTAMEGGDRLVVANPTDQLRVLYIDGVAVAWAAPGAQDALRGLVRGRYVGQWRTFLGESVEPPIALTVPGTAEPVSPKPAAPR